MDEGSAEFLLFICVLVILISTVFSFQRFTKRERFAKLRESGQTLDLNFRYLFSAYFRKFNDPLRKDHVLIANIGVLHLVVAIFAMFSVPVIIEQLFGGAV